MASAWIFLQYAECFAGGFLASYLLCSRSPKNRVKKEENILPDADPETEIVVITEEITAKMSDLRNNYTHGGIADGKQEEQAKQDQEETKNAKEGQEIKKIKNTEYWIWRKIFH